VGLAPTKTLVFDKPTQIGQLIEHTSWEIVLSLASFGIRGKGFDIWCDDYAV
jgi:hypothetical protein